MNFKIFSTKIILCVLISIGFLGDHKKWTVNAVDVTDQITLLDNTNLRIFFHNFRNWLFNTIGKTGIRTKGSFLQEKFPDDVDFPCDLRNGKSKEVPTSVHKLRPGDINVIAAMGDSLTAASGASATRFLDLSMENRGLAWSIGGQWNWRNVTTLPNILKVYNPKLVGYSYGDSYPFHKDSQFNIAEIGAVSYDLPFMARAIVKRIKADPRVDFENDWKLITLSIGGNDICSFVCTMENPEMLPQKHKQRLAKALRYLRDNSPRTFVNVVSVPSVETVISLKAKPKTCHRLHHGECSCWVGKLSYQSKESRKRWHRIQTEYIRVEEEVAKLQEFRGLEEFAVVHQPWSLNISLTMNGKNIDYSLLAFDCFHMSQKGNAYAGTALWNNLLEPPGNKSTNWSPIFDYFRCPSKEHPYIYTYDNS